jgi:hypothetical protein
MDCFRQKPRCRLCGLPVAFDSPNGVCTTCRESLRFCLACGVPIADKFFEFDGVGPYCQSCAQERPPCDICGAPLTDERWQLSDGRNMCAHCHLTAIYAPAAAHTLYEEMKAVVLQQLGFKLNVPTGLALVDRNQLGEVLRQQQDALPAGEINSNGLDLQRTLGVYARRGMRRGLYVQTGLPRMLFLQVAAHEYAHAWQGENLPVLRDALLHEGFAEWVAYRLVGFYGFTRGQERMLDRHDIYGQGLKQVLGLEAKQGVNGVVEACRRSV